MTVNMTTQAVQMATLMGGNLYAAPLSDETKKMPTVDTSGRFKTKNKKHEAKIIKKWHIQDFQITSLYIQVNGHALPMGQTQRLNIRRYDIDNWLRRTGRLSWYVMGKYGIRKYKGQMHPADYWEHECAEVLMEDLDEYIRQSELIA